MASRHELRRVATPEDWRLMHDIRRATLFAPGRHDDHFEYDENHPDDRAPGHEPLLLMLDGEAIGVTRLDDHHDGAGVVRLVAIAPALQRQGHGRILGELVEAEARRRGFSRLYVNAHHSAVGFYQRTGWGIETWDPAELVGIAASCVQMVKPLVPARA